MITTAIDNYKQAKRLEYAAAHAEDMMLTNSIAFVKLAENGIIDDVTATEHINMFENWGAYIAYAMNDIRSYNGALYKCLQAHTSQEGWEPDKAAALWKKIGDPTVEYPEWSAPVGAMDAYMKGDKVTHKDVRYISLVDNNVWEPGAIGTETLWQRVQ